MKSDITKAMHRFLDGVGEKPQAFGDIGFLALRLKVDQFADDPEDMDFPFFGGMNFSILSLKKITPTLSLFWMAESKHGCNFRDQFLFELLPGAKSVGAADIDQQHDGQFPFFIKDLDIRMVEPGVTFQSMLRISSPYWYSLTSLKAIPLPLKTQWY